MDGFQIVAIGRRWGHRRRRVAVACFPTATMQGYDNLGCTRDKQSQIR